MNLQRLPFKNDPALAALHRCEPGESALLLHAGRFDRRWASRSILAQPTCWYRYTADGAGQLQTVGDQRMPAIALTGDIWGDLRLLLNHPALPGRWIGYLSYDLGRLIEPDKLAPPTAGTWPLVELGYCPQVQTFAPPQAGPEQREGPDHELIHTNTDEILTADFPQTLTADFTRAEYEAAVGRVIEHIAAGDIFQANLAQRFTATCTGSPRDLYASLATISPAWYGAYLELGDHRALLSTSPELFLQVTDGHIITRPIKGTRAVKPEARNPKPEDPNYIALLNSEKDAAELAMIVDLMRNDLGRVCRYGSVRVTDPRAIETHPTVYHTTSTIEGDLQGDKDMIDLLQATLPGGSITGAPKVRAMQIIDALEPVHRGPYCGCIGYLSRDAMCLNIAIRMMMLERKGGREEGTEGRSTRSAATRGGARRISLMNREGRKQEAGRGEEVQASMMKYPTSDIRHPIWNISFSVGGGIVADSDPAAEFDETLTKAQAMLRALDWNSSKHT